MNLLFNGPWGALYLAVLITTMIPAIMTRGKFFLAAAMLLMWAVDRCSMAMLEYPVSLFYLAFAHTIMAVALLWLNQSRRAMVVSAMLAASSVAFILGGMGLLSWDDTGTIQEATGYIAMLTITFWRPDHGTLVRTEVRHDRPASVQSGSAPVHHHHRGHRR